MCPSQGVIFQMLAQRFENAVPARGWKGGGCRRRHQPDRRTLHHTSLVMVGLLGADVGTNLIDGHSTGQDSFSLPTRCRRRHQPDRRTLGWVQQVIERNVGADVGTNLIDGHWTPAPGRTVARGCRRRHQPDRRTPLLNSRQVCDTTCDTSLW